MTANSLFLIGILVLGPPTEVVVTAPPKRPDASLLNLYGFIKGRWLANCLRKGMTQQEVNSILGPPRNIGFTLHSVAEVRDDLGVTVAYVVEADILPTGEWIVICRLEIIELWQWADFVSRLQPSKSPIPLSH
jgi:hypothetical protein